MATLDFMVDDRLIRANIQHLVIAGWTGRDAISVEQHIEELEAIGVARPRNVPCFYRVGANLLTTGADVEVCGSDSSGEVEFVLVALDAGLFVGLGSDHTDRKVEAYGVTVAKQMCPKPLGRELWPFDELKGHWDNLVLRSWVTSSGRRELYQEGTVARMHTPEVLVTNYMGEGHALDPGTVMYCGTLPVLGVIGHGERFEIELEDPIRGRNLRHAYNAHSLPYMD